MNVPIRSARGLLGPLLVVEVVAFAINGTNFLTVGNGFEVARLTVEIGLLAVALTPLIVGGGIDLSVGPLMGLAAVAFGLAWRDLGLPIPLAAAAAIGVGAVGGGLNGLLVAGRGLPPLIVTLGSASLFRGVAIGLTKGVDNVTNFPAGFLFLGQGYLFGLIPAQVPIFAAVAGLTWLVMARGTAGRGLVAAGFSPEGARHAGLPVARLVGSTYLAAGAVAGLAAVIYVAHLGQAKADAGLNYELAAITAVVLGGTSIFGGRGDVGGTLLGLAAIAVLQNGLRLSDLPSEWAGIGTGAVLLVAIGLDRRSPIRPRPTTSTTTDEETFTVKNAQVALICLAVLAAGAIVAVSNVYLARSLREGRTEDREIATRPGPITAPGPPTGRRPVIAMMPKSKGNPYFIACKVGAEEAAREAGVTLIWDGPTDPDPSKQNEVVDTWITRGVDVIAVAVENRVGISSVLRKARAKGIKVITWDADAEPDARDFFVNQATPEGIGRTLMDTAASIMGGKGKFAIITASLTASNMIEWQKTIEARRAEKYPSIAMAALRPCDDLQRRAFDEANALLNADPEIKLIMGICTPAVPGAAEAVKQSGRSDVKVIGLGLPNINKPFVRDGIIPAVILWKTADLGYLTVLAARDLADGALKPKATAIDAGRLGRIAIEGDNILLGTPFTFTKENIEGFDF